MGHVTNKYYIFIYYIYIYVYIYVYIYIIKRKSFVRVILTFQKSCLCRREVEKNILHGELGFIKTLTLEFLLEMLCRNTNVDI